jgi:hypothetical protein
MVVPVPFWNVSSSRNTSDDVISDPALGPCRIRGFLGDGQFDHNTHVCHSGPRRTLHPRVGWTSAKDSGGKDRTAEQCGNDRRRSADRNLLANGDLGELKIVHHCRRNTVDVEHLTVEEVQLSVQPASSFILFFRGHCPAPVMIKSGIAASAAARMITR